jgi:hypothetical protein
LETRPTADPLPGKETSLTIAHTTVEDAGRLRLTGVLHGAATDRAGAVIRVRQQPFTVPASVMPSDRTTDVLLLRLAPVALASVSGRLTLAPIPLDVDVIPDGGDMLVSRLPAQ